jgi:hypothetical protein
VSIERRDAIQPAFDALLGLADEVFPVDARDVARAKALMAYGSSSPQPDMVQSFRLAQIARIDW